MDYIIDTTIQFNLLGVDRTGTVVGHDKKENALRVLSNKTTYLVYLTEKESKFCFIKNN